MFSGVGSLKHRSNFSSNFLEQLSMPVWWMAVCPQNTFPIVCVLSAQKSLSLCLIRSICHRRIFITPFLLIYAFFPVVSLLFLHLDVSFSHVLPDLCRFSILHTGLCCYHLFSALCHFPLSF